MSKKSSNESRRRRPGLGIFLTLLILLIIAGTVFWFGWFRFSLEEGQTAVIHTKLDGYEPEPIIGGQFDWSWHLWRLHALIPTNLTLHTFDTSPRQIIIEQTGSLPSGEIYAAVAGEDISFNWSFQASVSYSITPETVAKLAAEGALSSGLDGFYEEYEAKLTNKMTTALSSKSFQNKLPGQIQEELLKWAQKIDPRVSIQKVILLQWKMPDMDLYAETRRIYLDNMAKRQAVLTEVENTALRRKDLRDARLELLEYYGEKLHKYPELLDFFALEGNPGAALLPPESAE